MDQYDSLIPGYIIHEWMTGEALESTYPHIDSDGLRAGCSCGSTVKILRQNPEAAIVLSSAAVVLRTVQTYVYIY